jgi:uncharacterized protein (DUF1697 family)
MLKIGREAAEIEASEYDQRNAALAAEPQAVRRRAMSRYVAFVRAINVGRGRSLKMERLRGIFKALRLSDVTTIIASGNVLFDSRAKSAKALRRRIEKGISQELGYEVAVFIRSERALPEIARYAPFPKAKARGAAELNIIFLSNRLSSRLAKGIKALRTSTDEFHPRGQEVYWLRRRKQTGGDFSAVPLERVLKEPFTVRSANTVKKIAARLAQKG